MTRSTQRDRDSRPLRIVLGSSSPRRREILGALLDGRIEIRHPEADERVAPGEPPADYARRVAHAKAQSVCSSLGPPDGSDVLVIASDTIVTIDGRIIGKPNDRADAERILASLVGRTHQVISGLTLAHRPALGAPDSWNMHTGLEATEVTFFPLSPDGIARYLDCIDYADKAGAYALQENGGMIVRSVNGSMTNVIGFPLRLFFGMISALTGADAVFISSSRAP
ncbi:MAG TPA: Maf family protein [Spirochaetota bacterium]|nr:Maf family protein [Spirochaetota bacterium]HPI21832.1 Maf family protein [Spirochaetota bacterium]HPU89417.1 Maf family protein [Spirochaetota bacterium]